MAAVEEPSVLGAAGGSDPPGGEGGGDPLKPPPGGGHPEISAPKTADDDEQAGTVAAGGGGEPDSVKKVAGGRGQQRKAAAEGGRAAPDPSKKVAGDSGRKSAAGQGQQREETAAASSRDTPDSSRKPAGDSRRKAAAGRQAGAEASPGAAVPAEAPATPAKARPASSRKRAVGDVDEGSSEDREDPDRRSTSRRHGGGGGRRMRFPAQTRERPRQPRRPQTCNACGCFYVCRRSSPTGYGFCTNMGCTRAFDAKRERRRSRSRRSRSARRSPQPIPKALPGAARAERELRLRRAQSGEERHRAEKGRILRELHRSGATPFDDAGGEVSPEVEEVPDDDEDVEQPADASEERFLAIEGLLRDAAAEAEALAAENPEGFMSVDVNLTLDAEGNVDIIHVPDSGTDDSWGSWGAPALDTQGSSPGQTLPVADAEAGAAGGEAAGAAASSVAPQEAVQAQAGGQPGPSTARPQMPGRPATADAAVQAGTLALHAAADALAQLRSPRVRLGAKILGEAMDAVRVAFKTLEDIEAQANPPQRPTSPPTPPDRKQ